MYFLYQDSIKKLKISYISDYTNKKEIRTKLF